MFCVSFAVGIALSVGLGAVPPWTPLVWAVATALAMALRSLATMGVAVACVGVLAGLWVGAAQPPAPRPLAPGPHQAIARVVGARPGVDTTIVLADLVALRADGEWVADARRVAIPAESLSWLPQYGDVVVVSGEAESPRRALHSYAFDPGRYAHVRGISATFRPSTEPALVRSGRGIRAGIDRLRIRMERAILSRVEAPVSGMLVAITTGSRGQLDPTLRARFANNGAAHVLAVSGLHLGLLSGAAFVLLGGLFRCLPVVTRRMPAKRGAAMTTIPLVLVYVLITGAPASAIRAGTMAVIVLLGVAMNRRASAVHAVCLAATGMLAVKPLWITDIGFQLSVSATLSLVLAGRTTRGGWLLASIRVSTVASIATTPILLWHFGKTPLMSPITNLIVVPPIAFVALPCTVVGALLDAAGLPGAAPLLWLAAKASTLSFWVAERGAPLLEWNVVWGRPGWVALLGWSSAAVASPWLGRASLRAHVAVALVCGACCVVDPPPASRSGDMVMHAIPVGQGDATLVQMPDGFRMLVDGGGSPFARQSVGLTAVLPYLSGIGVARVDVVVMSHPDFDHAGGLPELVLALRPREVWLPGGESRAITERVIAAAHQVGARVRVFQLPYVRQAAGGRIEVVPAAPGMDANNGGLVMRTCFDDVCFSLPGDIEHEREEALTRSSIPLRADVLKVPHHGSMTSSTASYLDAVQPSVALFHVGEENRFNFPRPAVVERYRARGVRSYRTDRGEAVVWTDGERLRVFGALWDGRCGPVRCR